MKKLASVFALALVLVLAMGAAAFAAPEGADRISNHLTGEFVVEPPPPKSVEAGDFSAGIWPEPPGTFGQVKGYNVGFNLINATLDDVESITVTLYKGDVLMQTNTMAKGFNTKYPGASGLSCPFDVFGNFDYESDDCWTEGEWNPLVSHLTVPDKASIDVKFDDDTSITIENTSPSFIDIDGIVPWDELMELSWTASETNNITSPFQISVTAESEYIIDKVQFIAEITNNGDITSVVAGDGQALGHNEDEDYWYWGPDGGFTFANSSPVTTTFTVTAAPGTYGVDIYAVRLP